MECGVCWLLALKSLSGGLSILDFRLQIAGFSWCSWFKYRLAEALWVNQLEFVFQVLLNRAIRCGIIIWQMCWHVSALHCFQWVALQYFETIPAPVGSAMRWWMILRLVLSWSPGRSCCPLAGLWLYIAVVVSLLLLLLVVLFFFSPSPSSSFSSSSSFLPVLLLIIFLILILLLICFLFFFLYFFLSFLLSFFPSFFLSFFLSLIISLFLSFFISLFLSSFLPFFLLLFLLLLLVCSVYPVQALHSLVRAMVA